MESIDHLNALCWTHGGLDEQGANVADATLQFTGNTVVDFHGVGQEFIVGLLDRTKGGVEGHLVARLDDHGAGQTGGENGRVKGGWNGARHLATGTEHGTEVATDEAHVRHFGKEEVVLVGDLLGLSLLATEVFDVLRREDSKTGSLGLGGGFAGGEHGDLEFTTSTGRKTNLFLDTVGWVLQVDILDGERDVHGFDKLSLGGRFNGRLDCFADFFFHLASPLRSARPKPLPRFVSVQLKRSSHSPFAMISRASTAQ